MTTADPTHAEYLDSIEDPFFQSVAQQVVGTAADDENDTVKAANKRLEDMEIAVRKELFQVLLSQDEDDENKTAETIGVFWKATLDLCHHLVYHALSSTTSSSSSSKYDNLVPCRRLPYVLLSDCLEGLPSLEDAQHFWGNYVEPALVESLLFGDAFWNQLTESNNPKKISMSNSHLPFLKVTNQFLKRLEHASDSAVKIEWKGRILWALARGFSIADKSALKLWGNFHTANETDFERKEDFHEASGVDYNLYEAFWSLQHDFSNPNKLNVADFIKKLRLALSAMESASTIHSSRDTCGVVATTKYLTSSALLPSQIQDPSFRSSVVTQFLIVASHLSAESPPLKNALSSLLTRALKLLKKDRPQLFEILWDSILSNGREDDWRTWKKQKCAASVFASNGNKGRPVVLDYHPSTKRQRTGEDTITTVGENSHLVSAVSGNISNNYDLVAISRDVRAKIPTLEDHVETYVDALDPDAGIEDDYHPKNDSLFTWRAMRLYAKHQLSLMSQCRRPADLERITREWYRQTNDGKEIPGEMPAMDDSEDEEKEDTPAPVDGSGDEEEEETNGTDDKTEDADDKTDTEMKDADTTEEAEKEKPDEKDNKVVEETNKEELVDLTMEDLPDEETLNGKTIDSETEEKEPVKSDTVAQSTKTKTETLDEPKQKDEMTEEPKQKDGKTTDSSPKPIASNGSGEPSRNDRGRNNGNASNQRTPRENNNAGNIKFTPPPNRTGGRRGDTNGGGRNSQERERGRREEGPPRRDDNGPPPRQRGDDGPPPRGGRSGGEAPYNRGRSDGPPQRRGGGRYDDDYRVDNRVDRFGGDRGDRSGDRGNYRGGSGSGGGGRGIGRDDHRGGENGADRNRRTNDRPRDGGRGGRRRR